MQILFYNSQYNDSLYIYPISYLHAAVVLSPLRTSNIYRSSHNLLLSISPCWGEGALWKYIYPWAISSDPSPDNITVVSVFSLIYLLTKYIPEKYFFFYIPPTNVDLTYSVTLVHPFVRLSVTLWLISWFGSISQKNTWYCNDTPHVGQ